MTRVDDMTIDAYCTVGVDREYDLTDSVLLQAMDAAQVDRAVIASVDRLLAVNNREGNDFLRRTASCHSSRLIPSCSVNPWYGDPALQELERALGEGARILVLHPFVQGYLANDELVFPILDLSAREKVPVYIHTGPPGNSTPWQVADLSERYPTLDFIMGHCGATDFWNDVSVVGAATTNVYLESSLARPSNFARYLQQLGKDRGIMGSFAPINDLGFEWEQVRQVLPLEEWGDVYGRNLVRLLEKRGVL